MKLTKIIIYAFLLIYFAVTMTYGDETHHSNLWKSESLLLQFPEEEVGLWEVSEVWNDEGAKISVWVSPSHPGHDINICTCPFEESQKHLITEILSRENIKIIKRSDSEALFESTAHFHSLHRVIFTKCSTHTISYFNDEGPFTDQEKPKWITLIESALLITHDH